MAQFYSPKRKTAKITKKMQVTVDKLDHQSQGIVSQDNKIVFVPGVLPGEKVEIQLVDQKKKFARGKLNRIVEPSAERIAPTCEHYETCGGCSFQYLDGQNQLKYKQLGLAERLRSLADNAEWAPPIESAPWHYRRRARVGVRVDRNTKELVLGFRQGGSNKLTPISHCQVLAAPFDQLFVPLHTLLNGLKVRNHIGHLEFIQATDASIIIIRHMKALSIKDIEKLKAFEGGHGICFFAQGDDGDIKLLDGQEAPELNYTVEGISLAFQPGDFIQVNESVNQKMVAQAMDWLALTPDDRVLDLFCGMGNFSLPMASRVKTLIGVEGVSDMVERARANSIAAGLDNCQFYHCDLEAPLNKQPWLAAGVDKLLLDPARDGAAGICRQLKQLGAEKVVYVSCNPASLARDTQIIQDQGYALEKIGVIDMFPQTHHLESMALFVKRKK